MTATTAMMVMSKENKTLRKESSWFRTKAEKEKENRDDEKIK